MVDSGASNSFASVWIATLTTVTSRIDMIAPSTTTEAMRRTPRSSLSSAAETVGGMGEAAIASQCSDKWRLDLRLWSIISLMAIVERPLRADAARNRARLLAAAKEVFAARGLDATMDEVARRAGVGVGTAYRRFRNRDELIAALFEERLEEFMAVIDESLADDDPWRGLSSFLERSMEMQAADRGFKELLLQSAEGPERMRLFRARIRPMVAELVRRAREAGALRADVVEDDVLLVSLMTGAVADFAHAVEPQLWRRALALLLDGLRANNASPLPVGPLDADQADRAMAAWRPGRR